MHNLQSAGQHHIIISVCTVVILVYITADHHYALGLLGSGKHTVSGAFDVIVCCGYQFAGIGNLAQENPDTKFILIDSWPTVDGTEVTADQVIENVYAAYYAPL